MHGGVRFFTTESESKIISAAMNLVPDTLDCTLEYTSKEVAGATAILPAQLGMRMSLSAC